ncbi:hypothetical protein Back11_11940 [Paenibacillus baekrokdamisoli]|uniref:Uncharacterized protein n=1 Tax=Paenibacillus baekrokdamisoli TaxID=1712516 RepID=A0A3G9JA36_9BACL|nr:hypothetical protein [Paenibacillus baekrokdamisoli]MBB3070499.1 SOS-response transcriptional repressor LexA [Paenibacillus baekrokdamisoli]BBH19849.1 hypothetical protein Back11_11940 [Paenibacillus baekrokdamisoli]
MKLTEKNKEVGIAIQKFMSKHGQAPTVREIGKMLRINVGPVYVHLTRLKEMDIIEWDPEQSRTFRILQPEQLVLAPPMEF